MSEITSRPGIKWTFAEKGITVDATDADPALLVGWMSWQSIIEMAKKTPAAFPIGMLSRINPHGDQDQTQPQGTASQETRRSEG